MDDHRQTNQRWPSILLWLLLGVAMGVAVVFLFRQGLPNLGQMMQKNAVTNEAATPAVSTPAPTLAEEVEWRFYDWIVLWVDREADAYLAMFDPSFPDWETYSKNRRQRMQAAAFIEINVEDVNITQTSPDEVVVRFVQMYKSDSHRSKDLKELVWRQTKDGPKIFLERSVK